MGRVCCSAIHEKGWKGKTSWSREVESGEERFRPGTWGLLGEDDGLVARCVGELRLGLLGTGEGSGGWD